MEDEIKVPRFTGYAVLNSEEKEHRGLHGESLMYPNKEFTKMKMEESGGFKVVRVAVYDDGTAKITDVTSRE